MNRTYFYIYLDIKQRLIIRLSISETLEFEICIFLLFTVTDVYDDYIMSPRFDFIKKIPF